MILKTVFEKLFKIREEAGRTRKERAGADEGFDPHEKPFLDHLEDLRKTLMQMVITLLIITIGTFAFNQQIFDFVQLPLKVAEIDDVGTRLWDVSNLMTLSPQEMLMLAIKTSFIAGIILAFPLLVYQLFQFILPGLRQVEKKMIIPGAGVGFILFLGGASFAFFLATPIALKFFYQFEQERVNSIDPTAEAMKKPIGEFALIGLDGKPIPAPEKEGEVVPDLQGEDTPKTEGEGKVEAGTPKVEGEPAAPPKVSSLDEGTKQEIRDYMFQLFAFREGSEIALRYDDSRDKIVIMKVKGKSTEYRMGDYINFVTRLVLVFGLSFQLPVVVTILVKLELLTARVMKATRAYAWVIMMVAAAIFTPPDIITLGLLAGPLILLYEICIIIASAMERSREKRRKAEEEARQKRRAELLARKAEDLTEEEKEELHRQEIEQYEKEHAHLLETGYGDDHNYDDPYHNDPYHDEHGHPIDPHHDDYHDEHGNPIDPHHDDPYHHGEHDESWHHDHDDPHHGEEEHQPIQDWPDREDEKSDDKPVLESDHAELTEDADPEPEKDLSFDDDEVCDPSGPIVDLNFAEFDEIMDLPGVDEELAQMLIDHRPYASFDDVEDVPGMDADKLNEMMERLMLG